MILRDYQVKAVNCVFDQWSRVQSALLVLPTGMGKTVVFTSIIDRALTGNHKRALVLCHRDELVRQAAAKITACTPHFCDIEMGMERAANDWMSKAKVVVASTQTMLRRGTRFNPEEFGVVVADEAHHYVSPTWRGVVEHFKSNKACKILGVTATPDRGDRLALGMVFDTVAYEMEITDGIDLGWLVPIDQRIVRVRDMDLSDVGTVAGDLNARDLAETMGAEKVLHPIVRSIMEIANGKRTIVFAPPGFKKEGEGHFRVSERMTELFNRYQPGCAELVCDETPKDVRRDLLGRFKSGDLPVVVNVGVLTEGFDDPAIKVVAIARPTKSRALYAQMVGRGTRPLAGCVDGLDGSGARCSAIRGSGKSSLLVLDFEGNSGRHKLVNALDILGGKYDGDVVELARKLVADSGDTMEVREALEEAAKLRKEQEAAEARAKARRREMIRAKTVHYTTHSVDPFDILDIKYTAPTNNYLHAEPATEKQIALLAKWRVPINETLTKKGASKLIGELMQRKNVGLCGYWWAEQVRRYGGNPKGMSTQEAKEFVNGRKGVPRLGGL